MFIFFVLAGAVAGVLGGMGMGGTLLSPILTIFLDVEQHVAQGINLISFIPMAVVALILHIKNKLVDFKGVILIIISGVVFSVLGTIIAKFINGETLTKVFGGFLFALGILQLVLGFKERKDTN